MKKLTSNFYIDVRTLVDYLPMPSCALCRGNIEYKNSAFVEAQIDFKPYDDEYVYVAPKKYKVIKSQIQKGFDLFIFQDITECEALLKQNLRFKTELELAKNIQSSLLKNNFPKIEGYDFVVSYFPSAAVGGDLFDIITLQDGKVLIYVADVSGHGIAAAMMTVFFKQEISIFCRHSNFSIKRLIVFLNERLNGLNCGDKVYLTLFMAIIDTNTGELKYYNAGHSAIPLLRKNDGTVKELYFPGVPICTWGLKADYKPRHINLLEGERLILYTDGMFPGKEYEAAFEKFKELFGSLSYSKKEFIDIVFEKIINQPEDDVMMIICERTKVD